MMKKTCRIMVSGLVQGIGFRPFVAELAEKLKLAGQVKNLGGIVEIVVSGEIQMVDTFIQRLSCAGKCIDGEDIGVSNDGTEIEKLPGCRIDSMEVEAWENGEEMYPLVDVENNIHSFEASIGHSWNGKFHIVESGIGREVRRFLPVDLPTCDRCVAEMHDSENRRYRYPFISCTSCGPRFSIQKNVPYDRETITMDEFPMCESCRQEYMEKGNIRRHAQTIACKECGPRLKFISVQDRDNVLGENGTVDKTKNGINNTTKTVQDFLQISNEQQAISEAVQALKNGAIGAVKDIGGYHFAFSPFNIKAAKRLRAFKNRDKKPFAVMFLNLDEVKAYCEVSEKEAAILLSPARPIVLLKKKKDFVSEICGESDRIGALLPCNPLQILLLEETGPLVMTSGNRGGEPIIISEEEMMQHIGNGIDFMLTHDREILTPLDDSIYQVTELKEICVSRIDMKKKYAVQLIRRARGLAPEPIILHRKLSKDTFAAGGDLKAVFGLGRDELVYLSQYFGDLEDVRCMESRQCGRARMEKLLEIHPEQTIGDLHPSYISSQNMNKKVQHHHAHVASVIAEHGLEGKVLGIACDGTGFGTDGTIWGSEFLLCENEKMERVGHFSSVKLIGGDASAKQADLTLYSFMLEGKERGLDVEAFFRECEDNCVDEIGNPDEAGKQRLKLQEMAWKQNINTAYSSSMGRLFDAVAALLDICHFNSYEGECAIRLEQAAHKGFLELFRNQDILTVKNRSGIQNADMFLNMHTEEEKLEEILKLNFELQKGVWQANSVKLLEDLYQLKSTYSKEVLAYVFHHAVASGMVELADKICREKAVNQIALSGGTFINRILLQEVAGGLCQKGRKVYWNEKVPCGDGGIALGQMYLATYGGKCMMQIKNLTITHRKDNRVLLQDLTLTLNPGDKAAIIGEEGNGKSTLLKLIFDETLVEDYIEYTGEIIKNHIHIGYLPQEMDTAEKTKSAYEFMCESPLFYETAQGELAQISRMLKIPMEMFYSEQLLGEMSGGEKIKLQLARIIVNKPDVLFLDEPSNDLDMDTVYWLEEFIQKSSLPILYISHDEVLLENTANKIIHLEQIKRKKESRSTVIKSSYKDYISRRSSSLAHQEQVARKERSEYQKQQEKFRQIQQKVEHQQKVITRQDPHGGALLKKTMHRVKAYEARFEKEFQNMTEIPETEDAIFIKFGADAGIPAGKVVLDYHLPKLYIEDRLIDSEAAKSSGAEIFHRCQTL